MLSSLEEGDQAVIHDLFAIVAPELRRIAVRQMRGKSGTLMQPTVLVDDAFCALVGQGVEYSFESRRHFYGMASKVMCHLVIDHLRKKRSGRVTMEEMDRLVACYESGSVNLLDLDPLLQRLEAEAPLLSEVIHLRFWLGQSASEIAETLGMTPRTAARELKLAKARLKIWMNHE